MGGVFTKVYWQYRRYTSGNTNVIFYSTCKLYGFELFPLEFPLVLIISHVWYYSFHILLINKINIFNEIFRLLSINYKIFQDLRSGNKITVSRSTVLRKQGEILTLRHLINLCSDLLDTPDVYWDRDRLESLYTKTCQYLNIPRRTKVSPRVATSSSDLWSNV